MKRKFAITVLTGLIGIMVAILPACSKDDDPQPQNVSLATSYVMPTSMSMTDIKSYPEEERHMKVTCFSFQGPVITEESNPEEFASLNRFFGDTACSKNAFNFWPKEKHNFLGKPIVSIKAIATDDTWGAKFPSGADVSSLLQMTCLSANSYIKSNYLNPACRKEINCSMNEWQPQWGYSIYNNFSFYLPITRGEPTTNGVHLADNCKGHRYTLTVTFADGKFEKTDCYIYCTVRAFASSRLEAHK